MKTSARYLILSLLFFLVACDPDSCEPDPDPSPNPGTDAGVDVGTDGDLPDAPIDSPCGCAADETCVEGTCLPPCGPADECTDPQICYDGEFCAPADLCSVITCAAGTTCVQGDCRKDCVAQSECDSTDVCTVAGYCEPSDACDGIWCPVGQVCYGGACYDPCADNGDCTPPDVCYDSRCTTDPCDGVNCPVGQVCYEGGCYDPCAADGDCTPPDLCYLDHCTSDPCDGVQCPVGDVCYGGSCFAPCTANADCEFDEACFEGRCEVGSCDGVLCPSSQVCFGGSCFDTCTANTDCGAGEACYEGRCAADPCGDIQCPVGQVCYGGACYDPCVDNGECTPPDLCYDSRCTADPCDGVQCPVGEVCAGGACFDPCAQSGDCTPPNLCYADHCATDACSGIQCPVGQVCYGGGCYDPCNVDGDCTPPNLCYDGRCAASPCDDVTCPVGDVCYEGACYAPCFDDGDCTPPDICFVSVCQNHPCDGAACPSVTPGTPESGALPAAGESANFTFAAEEGELVTLETSSADMSGSMQIYDPNFGLLESVPYSPGSKAWIPLRIPQTGTYTVTIVSSSGAGNYDLIYTSFGLETPTESPNFTGITAATGTDQYYFFAEPDELFAGDVVPDPTGSFTSGNLFFELLLPDGTWTQTLETVPGHALTTTFDTSTPGTILAGATDRGIYRFRYTRNLGSNAMTVRLGKMAEATTTAPILVDSQGLCAGHQTGIPRLGAAALLDGGTLEICDGVHPEYGTIVFAASTGEVLRGAAGATAVIRYENTSTIGANLLLIDGTTDFTIENLGLGIDGSASGNLVAFGQPATNTVIRNVTVEIVGTSPFGVGPSIFNSGGSAHDGTLVEDFTLTGSGRVGVLIGDDIVVRRANVATGSSDAYADFGIEGARALVEESTFGAAGQLTGLGGILMRGDDLTFRRNTVYTRQQPTTFAGPVGGRALNVTLDGNSLINDGTSARNVIVENVDGLVVSNNLVEHAGTDVALLLTEVSGEVYNNRVTAPADDLVRVANTDSLSVSRTVQLYNNTIVFGGTGAGNGIRIDISPSGADTVDIEIFNNVFVNEATTPASNQCGYRQDRPLLFADYNLFDGYLSPPCSGGAFNALGTNSVQGASNLDADYKLTAGSLAIDAGLTTRAPASDFEGEARPKGAEADIGADEL